MMITYTKEQILALISETLINHNYFIYHTRYCTTDNLSAFMYFHGFTLAEVPQYGFVDQSSGKAYTEEMEVTTYRKLLTPQNKIKELDRLFITSFLEEQLINYNSYIPAGFLDNYEELQSIIKPFEYEIIMISKPHEDYEDEWVEELGYRDTTTGKVYDSIGFEAEPMISYTDNQVLAFIRETLVNHNSFAHANPIKVEQLAHFMDYHVYTLAKVEMEEGIAYGYVDQSTNKVYTDNHQETRLIEDLSLEDFISHIDKQFIFQLLLEALNEYNRYLGYGFTDHYTSLQEIVLPIGYKIVMIEHKEDGMKYEEFGYLDITTQKAYCLDGYEVKLAENS